MLLNQRPHFESHWVNAFTVLISVFFMKHFFFFCLYNTLLLCLLPYALFLLSICWSFLLCFVLKVEMLMKCLNVEISKCWNSPKCLNSPLSKYYFLLTSSNQLTRNNIHMLLTPTFLSFPLTSPWIPWRMFLPSYSYLIGILNFIWLILNSWVIF
jgi:hypothetical protein